jgi:monosaccharide-transporting ATPase
VDDCRFRHVRATPALQRYAALGALIDIGAKGEIQALVNELAADGLGVLMISSEIEELVEGSTRVVVLRDGVSVAELSGADVSETAIIHALAGHE